MHSRSTSVALAAAVAAAVCLAATAADAKCERFSYLVNDYGKDGPTRDAKNLLDKHIVKWAAEKGIKNYTVSTKTVKCELFLNFVVFDEHTCTATAQASSKRSGCSDSIFSISGSDSRFFSSSGRLRVQAKARPSS